MNSDNIVARLDATFENTLRFDAEFQAVYVVEKSNILYNTTAGWNSQAELVAKTGYLYVYIDYKQTEDNQNIAGFKVGDNTSLLIDLPFTDSIIYTSIEDIENRLNEIGYAIESLNTNKLDKNNPTGTGAFSLNRKAETTIGSNSFVEGYDNTASGSCAHAEGQGTTASGNNGSHAEGRQTTASGLQSHAEGYATTAAGAYSHAEGSATHTGLTALASHAEGSSTTASGANSHAEGEGTTASGKDSHAGGHGTIAKNLSQHVFGEFNIQDPANKSSTVRGTYVEIVGNGTNTNTRSNARTLDWSGNETLAGGLTASGNIDVKDSEGNTKISLNGSTGDISCTSINGVTPTEVAANPSDEGSADLTKIKIGNSIYDIPQGGGSGGHTIINNEGTSLTQRTKLQFNGAYSEDNSTDAITEVNVVRSMTKAEFDELTEAEKTGLINITDITSGKAVLFLNGKQVVTVEDTECSIVLGSTMPSDMGSPTITRSGSVVLLSFGINIPSGTYYNDTVLWTVEPKPKASIQGGVRYGSNFVNIKINTDGTITFNTQQSGNQWAVGQIIYLA